VALTELEAVLVGLTRRGVTFVSARELAEE
jgi:hypothetical protein